MEKLEHKVPFFRHSMHSCIKITVAKNAGVTNIDSLQWCMGELQSPAAPAPLVQLHWLRFQGMNLKFIAFGAWVYKCWTAWFIPWLHRMAQYLETPDTENSSTSFDGLYCNTSWESHRWCICHPYPSWQHLSFTDWGSKNNGIKGWMQDLSKFTWSKMMHYSRDNGGISIMRQTNALES